MFTTIDRWLRAQRRRLFTAFAVAILASAVLGAHSAVSAGHMGKGMAMCVAVVDVAFLAVGASLALRRGGAIGLARRSGVVLRPVPLDLARRHLPLARAGPAVLQVFRL
jgi:hypothetical protein